MEVEQIKIDEYNYNMKRNVAYEDKYEYIKSNSLTKCKSAENVTNFINEVIEFFNQSGKKLLKLWWVFY